MKRVLVIHNGKVDNDGRVIRSIDALSKRYYVCVASHDSDYNFNDERIESIGLKFGRLRILSHFIFAIKVYWAVRKFEFTAVYCHDFLSLPAVILFSFLRPDLPIIYDAHELLLRDPEDNGYSEYGSHWLWMESRCVKKVSLIIVANKERADVMFQYYGLLHMPTVVRNVYEGDISENYRVLDGELVLVYQGAINSDRGLFKIAKLFSCLGKRYRLAFVGAGDSLDALKDYVRDLSVSDRVEYYGRVDRDELYRILGNCHVGVVSYQMKGLNTKLCAPNKLYEYASMALPMLCSPQESMTSEVEGNGVGVSIAAEEWEQEVFPETVCQLERMVSKYAETSQRCIEYAKANTWERDHLIFLEKVSEVLSD